MPPVPPPQAPSPLPGLRLTERTEALRLKSQELEAAFLAEMLSFAGLGSSTSETGNGFDGGIGEEQFSSFLRQEQAKLMVQKGGIGLAEQIFQSLIKVHDDQSR